MLWTQYFSYYIDLDLDIDIDYCNLGLVEVHSLEQEKKKFPRDNNI